MKKKYIIILTGILALASCNNLIVRVGNVANRINENTKTNKKNYYPFPYSGLNIPRDSMKVFEDIPVKYINVSQLQRLIQSNDSMYKYICIFTSGCKGTPGEIRYANKYRQIFQSEIEFIFISSDNIAPYLVQMIQKKFFVNKFLYPAYIIDRQIKSFLDDRKRGEIFRNALCSECKSDIIGVPYVIFYSKDNRVLFHGYRGYKTDIPADIIAYFTKQ